MFMSNARLRRTVVFIGLLLAVYLWGLGGYGLLEPDEGRYAEIPREMLESGDFVTPTLNYVHYFEKPVLHYWLTALSMAIFGRNEFAVRLWPAVFALGGVLVTFLLARAMYGAPTANLASAILPTCLLYFVIGQINLTDMPLSFFMTVAMAGFWFGLERDRRWYLLFYGGMALALLTKGLIGIVLPCGIVFWYMALTRRWDIVRSVLSLPGILLFLALSVPWFALVCARNSDFFSFFFIREHFLRYATKIHDRYEPFWFFVPMLVAGLLPWMGLLPGALRSAWPSSLPVQDDEERKGLFLLLWFAVILLFFSLSDSKLIPYIVPLFPPLAILMARRLRRFAEGDALGARAFLLWSTALLAPLIVALAVYPFVQDKVPPSTLLSYAAALTGSLSLFLALGWHGYRRRTLRTMAVALCIAALANVFVLDRVLALYGRLSSSRPLADAVAELHRPGDRIVQYQDFDQSLPFYLEERIILADYLGELAFGAAKETDPRWFLDDAGLAGLWTGGQRTIVIAAEREWPQILPLLGLTPSDARTMVGKQALFVNQP